MKTKSPTHSAAKNEATLAIIDPSHLAALKGIAGSDRKALDKYIASALAPAPKATGLAGELQALKDAETAKILNAPQMPYEQLLPLSCATFGEANVFSACKQLPTQAERREALVGLFQNAGVIIGNVLETQNPTGIRSQLHQVQADKWISSQAK